LRARGNGNLRGEIKGLNTGDTGNRRGNESRGVMIAIRESDEGVTLSVRIHPRARKNAITGEMGDALKVSLTSPPLEGRANEACIEFFAKLLKVPRSSVSIASGQSSRNKTIRVVGLSVEHVRKRVGV
jgi:uncharacterized protein (TIGR00251 family)